MIDTAELFSLKGRSALITGGSRGIGRMIAEGFLRAGARVYISARKADACDATAAELSAIGPCVSLPADVSTQGGVQQLVASYQQHEKSLDILVNNAGAAWGAPYEEFPESGWDKVVDLNLKAPFFLTQALTPLLKRAATDHLAKVIHIASIDGVSVNPQGGADQVVIEMTVKQALRVAARESKAVRRSLVDKLEDMQAIRVPSKSTSGLTEYRGYYLTKATVSAKISQLYYAHNDYENGAYWSLRVINLLGISKGYNILGRIFVKDPKTVKIGAQMLSESAKHDNVNASVFLSDSVLFRNVFDIVSEEESNNNQIQDNSIENKQEISDDTENHLKK